jgi:hypothetical protein
MATIRASCPTCGDVELTTNDVTVRVCTDDDSGNYSFRCIHCALTVVKPAEPRTIDLLVASGVHMETWSMPLEVGERPVGLGPITHDELLDFHTMLDDDASWVEALESLG